MRRFLLILLFITVAFVAALPTVTATIICTPLGTLTTNLSLCKPATGEVNWDAAINNNVAIIDGLFPSGKLGVDRGGTGVDASAAANGSLLIGNGAGFTLANLTGGTGVNVSNGAGSITLIVAPRSYLAGCTLSNDGTLPNTVIDIAACVTMGDDQLTIMTQTTAYTKTTGAWAVGSGNGGLDTGSVANNTWYHVYQIKRTDTSVVDYLLSTSASSPTMPTSYTIKRRIGAIKTATGTTNLLTFVQDGDYFRWKASILDINANNPGTSAVTRTLTVPTGVSVYALMNAALTNAATTTECYLSDLGANDEAASASAAPLATFGAAIANVTAFWEGEIRTNTSAQIRSRLSGSGADVTLFIATLGWKDRRGRDN